MTGPTSGAVQILDLHGRPMKPAPGRARSLAGWGQAPYDAADIYGDHMAAWRPMLWSADNKLNPYRDRIVARARDIAANDGWANGAVTRILDNAIGANFRPLSKPDFRRLAAYSGNRAFDAVWADEYGKAVEAGWRTWADDVGCWCDAQRSLPMPEMFFLGFRHELVDGDALGLLYWLPERIGEGKATYATTVQLIDPDRLSNPQLVFDNQTMRGGVMVDDYGAATAYAIRRAHQGDWWAAADSMHWDIIPRETDWGRPIVVHSFARDQAAQHRGGAGVLTPVLQRIKMLVKYDGTELDAAILNAVFGAYIESPFDPQMVQEALGEGDGLGWYQDARKDFHDERKVMLGGARMPHLFSGEKIGTVTAARPTSNFADFEGAVLRNISAGTGLSAQQVSNNYAEVNYSSARAALLEAWKTLDRRRINFARGFGQPIYCAVLEEMHDAEELPLPAGAPSFMQCRTAYSKARWMGPGRGWIDPVAEKRAAVIGLDAGVDNLEGICAEQGLDYEVVAHQRKREMELYKQLDLPYPTWMNIQPIGTADQAAKMPEAV